MTTTRQLVGPFKNGPARQMRDTVYCKHAAGGFTLSLEEKRLGVLVEEKIADESTRSDMTYKRR